MKKATLALIEREAPSERPKTAPTFIPLQERLYAGGPNSVRGFRMPCIMAVNSLRAGRGIPRLFGFPAYGEGPFEHHGVPTTVPLLLAFFLVCLVEVAAGVPLWSGRKIGALLAIGVIPFGAVFWWGFALPIPPILALARAALILSSWRSFT